MKLKNTSENQKKARRSVPAQRGSKAKPRPLCILILLTSESGRESQKKKITKRNTERLSLLPIPQQQNNLFIVAGGKLADMERRSRPLNKSLYIFC